MDPRQVEDDQAEACGQHDPSHDPAPDGEQVGAGDGQ